MPALPPRPPLGDLTPEQFLAEYWQKKPLLIRRALPDFRSPLSPEELAGLACEDEVESRLVLEQGGDYPWQARQGPFEEAVFAQLPETHWSLLVQSVDQQVPGVADLLDHFRFIPDWRIDDIMISYAPPGGSVGPHTDSYDVFLLQIHGQRRWQISRDFAPELLQGPDLRILAEFRAEEEWVLDPGDMLYLPPGVAHHGVAVDDCMTLSVGFLAPTQVEMLADYLEQTLGDLDPERRYADPDLKLQVHSGEIGPDSLARVEAMIRELPLDPARISHWFGAFITRPQRELPPLPLEQPLSRADWLAALEQNEVLRRDCRLAFIREGDGALLFAAGESRPLPPELAFVAPLLCERRALNRAALSPILDDSRALALLVELTNQGYFYFA